MLRGSSRWDMISIPTSMVSIKDGNGRTTARITLRSSSRWKVISNSRNAYPKYLS